MANLHTDQELRIWQKFPLDIKVGMTQQRIREWVNEYGVDGVYVSFSGGKDSTVLLDIARKMYENIPAAWVDTGLEYPEIRSFVKKFDNVDILKPSVSFKEVITTYGYPVISKEVSNNVEGAKKYLAVLKERESNEGQSLRQPPYAYNYRRLCGIGEYAKRRLGKGKGVASKAGDSSGDPGSIRGEGDYP